MQALNGPPSKAAVDGTAIGRAFARVGEESSL
jgi:hypothetical protein